MTDYGRLIVALDVSSLDEFGELIDKLRTQVKIFKIGMEAYTSCGVAAIDMARIKGARIFLDLKFHDIPNTVRGAVKAAVKQGVYMLTIHTSGGVAMMKAAVEAAKEESERLSQERPMILGVTILTSLSGKDLVDIGIKRELKAQVLELVKLAKKAGLDGIVCSPQEVADVKKIVGDKMAIVVPGVRPAGSATADQKRVATPSEAVRAGADYLVVGRPITKSDDPRTSAERIVKEIKASLPK